MSDSGFTQEQLQALLQYASKRLGTTPEKLIQTVDSGSLDSLTSRLSPAEKSKVDAFLGDKQKAQQLLHTPEAQQLIQQALKDRKK